jgi:hypothetical protein
MRLGDVIKYIDESLVESRCGLVGTIVGLDVSEPANHTCPPIVEVLWVTGDIELVYLDEIQLVTS